MRLLSNLIIIFSCSLLSSCKKSIEFTELPPKTKPTDTTAVAEPSPHDVVFIDLPSDLYSNGIPNSKLTPASYQETIDQNFFIIAVNKVFTSSFLTN